MNSRIIIYMLLLGSMLSPLIAGFELPPAPNKPAKATFDFIENMPVLAGHYAFLFFDYGPGTQAESDPQAQLIFEHLLRKKIPIVIMTTYALSEKFTVTTPKKVIAKLKSENASTDYQYGKDYVVLGYRPGSSLFLQALSQSKNLQEFLGKDIEGARLSQYGPFKDLTTLSQVSFVGEFTGLVGFLGSYIQYLTSKDASVPIVHGCTSITIPETYIYTDSGQLKGVLEGIAGAAAYGKLMRERFKSTMIDDATVINSALGFGQLMILAFVIFGNLLQVRRKKVSR